MDDRPTARQTPPAVGDSGNTISDERQRQHRKSSSLHASSRSLRSLDLPSLDDDGGGPTSHRESSSGTQRPRTNRSGTSSGGGGSSDGDSSARRRGGRRRGRSPPRPRAERSASRLLCPSSAEESGTDGGGDGDSSLDGGAGGDDSPSGSDAAVSDSDPQQAVAAPTTSAAGSVPAGTGSTGAAAAATAASATRRRGRRRRPRQRPLASKKSPKRTTGAAGSSPTCSASADSAATGLYYFYRRTRSDSADSAEQLLSIPQALQRGAGEKRAAAVAGGGGGEPLSSPLAVGGAAGSHSGSHSGSDPRSGINSNLPAASPASKASRAMSAATRSQVTDGGWSTGTGSSHGSDHSDDESESFVSWNESEHGSLPSHHQRAKDAIVGSGGGGRKEEGGRRSSATNRLLTQLGVGAVPFDAPPGTEDRHCKPPTASAKPASAPRASPLSSSERARRLMDEAQRNVQIRRSKQMGLFGGYEREVPTSSSAAGRQREEGTSRGSSAGPSAVARALMDSLQDGGHGDDDGDGNDDDSSTADGCYEDVGKDDDGDGYDDGDADDRSAEASVHRLWGRVGIARPAYPFSFGEDDSRDRSAELDSEQSQRGAGDELEGSQTQQLRHDPDGGNTGNVLSKHPNSPSSKSSWISGSVSLDNDDNDDDIYAKVDENLKGKLGLGRSTLDTSNLNDSSSVAKKNNREEKEYDPFDLGSATTTDSGPVKPPRWLQDQRQSGSKQARHDDNPPSSSSSSSESSSSGSYTSGSSSESSLPAEYVVAEPGWDKGSVAESSIKSITAQLRSTVQEEAIREAGAVNKKPEQLPVYKRMFGRGKEQSRDVVRQKHVISSIREDPEDGESPVARKLDSFARGKVSSIPIHDPFDLRSSVDGENQELPQPPVIGEAQRATSSSSSSSSGSESSYTEGSSSVDTPPARMVVTKEDWAVGSVAESSIKSITAPVRAKVSSSPEKLPIYGKPSASMNNEQATGPIATVQSASQPSLEPLYVGWGADEADDNGESSHEGEDNYQAWPDSPQKLRKCPTKPLPTDVDSIQKGWVIVCIENIISPEKADEQELRAKRLSTMDHGVSSSDDASSSAESESASDDSLKSASGTESSGSDVVRKKLAKREQANPNIVHEEQRAVGNLSAMWEAKANRCKDGPSKDEAVLKSRKQAQERIGAFRLRRNGAIALQSAWRSYYARKKWLQIIRSAITIQNAVRVRLLKALKNVAARAALLIQSYWRSFRKRQTFVMKRKSACLVQSTYRGHAARQNYRFALRACVKLQALGRGHLQRLQTMCLKRHRAAAVIQVWWHSQLAQNLEVAAARQIQTVWRSHVVQKRYRCRQSVIVKVQAMVRGGLQKKQYARNRTLLRGVIALQSVARGARERSRLAKKNNAVLCIQYHYRTYKMSEAMKIERTTAANTIQRAARHSIARKRHQQKEASAILVQAHTRRMLAKNEFRRSVSAICVAQAWARGIICRCQLREAKQRHDIVNQSAVAIQSARRRYSAREVYRQMRSASIILQSAARGRSCRQAYRRQMALVNGVTSLQAVARGAQERRAMQRQVSAAKCLQSWWRRCVIAAEEENERSATTIASWWRMHSAQKSFAETRDATIYLQSTSRASTQRRQYQRMLRACVMIQAFVRRAIAQREQDKRLAAAILIQRTIRFVEVRRIVQEKETAAAIILQSSFRSMSSVRSYDRQRAASVSIQAAYRGSMQRIRFENYRSMVISLTALQAICRGMQQRKAISEQKEGATIIASNWRSYRARSKYLQVVKAAVLLQSVGRGSIVRRFQRQQAEANKSAAIIARNWRSRQARAKYLRVTRAVILLQAVGRGTRTRQCKRRDDAAAKCIQSTWRTFHVRRLCDVEMQRKDAAIKLQSVFRAALARSSFRRAKSSAQCIQRQARGWIQRDRFARYMYLIRGCISLQALARGIATRRVLTLNDDSARSIQHYWRAHKAYRWRQDEKRHSAAVVLQSSYRRMAAWKTYQRQQRSALLIQANYRMSAEKSRFRNYAAFVRGIVILQNIARSKFAHRTYEEKLRAVILLQAWFRSCRERDQFHRYIALVRSCIVFQALFRGSQVRKTLVTRETAATTIQQAWRLRQEEVKALHVGQTENNTDPQNKNDARAETEELTRFNTLAISVGSSSNISQYLCNESAKVGMTKDQSRISCSDSSDETCSVATKLSASDVSYDEDRVRHALVHGAAACGVASCIPTVGSNLSGEDEHRPDLVASDERSSGSNSEDDGAWLEGDIEAGKAKRLPDTSSVGSSHLSDYFDDDLPPASRKISSIQAAGVSSEASPKREVTRMDKDSSSSSSCSSSSISSNPVGFAPRMLPPVVEESFEYGTEEEYVDFESNIDLAPAEPSRTPPNVDERKIDCVVPSSYQPFGLSSIRARAEDLARQNTLISASSLMGSSSNLSSCFQDGDDDGLDSNKGQVNDQASDTNASQRSFGVSTAGQSTLQHEDKTVGAEIWHGTNGSGKHPQNISPDNDIEQGLHNDIATFAERDAYSKESSDENDTTEQMDLQEARVVDPHFNDLSNMEEGNRGERISLIDNTDLEQGVSSNPAIPSLSRPHFAQSSNTASQPPRKFIRSARPSSSTLLPMHADNTNGPPLPSENNKFISFYRGHRSWCYVFGLVGVLALVAGVVVAFTVDFSGNSSANAAGLGAGSSSLPTAAPSIAPTYRQDNQGGSYLRPSPAPTAFPTRQRPRPTWTSSVDDADYQRFIEVLSQVSNEGDILDTTSPQHKAMDWIASDKRIDPYGPFTAQRYVLALLYFSTNGDSWSKCGALSPACSDSRAAFLSNENECSWHGVSCNDDGFIVGLELDRVGMDGAIPEEIGILSYLERLFLPRNRLASTIPSSLGFLRNLRELDLFDNNLSGSIPREINQLPLEILQISTNKFTGSLPPIFNADLVILDVSANELSGTLPGELFDATSLQEVNLSMNQFSGTLSNDFGRLTELRKFLIGLNSFTGVVPDSIGNMKSLESLHATYNDLTGSVPNSICDLFDYRLKRLSTDCAAPDSGRPAKVVCSCCTLCLEGDE